MKFCPYCGASLPGSAASFCPECGKSLPAGRPVGVRRQKKRPPQEKFPKAPQRRPRPIDPMDVNYIWLTVLQCILAYMKGGQIKYPCPICRFSESWAGL